MGRTAGSSPDVIQNEDPRPAEAGQAKEPQGRPWQARPSSWLLITALFLFIGLFVTPKIFGGVFLFFPFLWMRGPRRRRPGDSPHRR